MAKTLNDPLLVLGRGIVMVLRALVGLAAVLFAIGLPLTIVMPEAVFSAMLEQDAVLPPGAIATLAGILGFGFATLLAAFYFLQKLLEITCSVSAGDPFAPANADRLTRMAWTALGIQVLAVPLAILQSRLQNLLDLDDAVLTVSFADNGLVLALVLFILARVFRHGAAMREELEGTV